MNRQKQKTILAFAAIYLIWGSTFFGVSIALKSFPPFLLSALRFLIGGLLLTGYCYFRKQPMPSVKEILSFSFWGIIIFGGGIIAVVWAQQYLPSSLASLIITTPFWFIVLDKSHWHINFKNYWTMTGLIAGLAGVLLLMSQKSSNQFQGVDFTQTKAILVMVAGSMLWVIGSLRLRGNQSSISVYAKTSIHLLAAGVFAIVVSLLSNESTSFNWQAIRIDSLFALLFLAILSTTLTFIAFVWLIQTKPVAMVSTYSYINPMVAVLLGVLVGGESINTIQVAAMFIILSGVFLVNIPKYKLKI
ncbi:EamA family transporter [Chryseotalea sanaruensis]|uniref:EamA family transporter n=1 Tax=Chryseotalea sanaruensis TaxID=2482724 RepID=A0A401UF44_9BACT|nr:EamA family transporter [Chryseotalea sanaruensis]GCC53516.1 EamA family transporter [Chryseotalea sanaruensis]